MGLWPNGDVPEIWSCRRLNEVENKIMKLYPSQFSPSGYAIWQRNTNWWTDEWGRTVAGITFCSGKFIHIGNDRTVFAHEMVHVLQNCAPELPIDEGQDADHADWIRKDIYNLIEEASQ